MIDIDFEEIEDELEIVIPNVYQMFIEAVTSKGYDLEKYGISYDTDTILAGNHKLRLELENAKPKWKNEYFDFGVGDGCGNYFFLVTSDIDSNEVKLWSHDPAGIENVGKATDFFLSLLSELEADFNGPNKYRFQGNSF